jgi:hypothetical protein
MKAKPDMAAVAPVPETKQHTDVRPVYAYNTPMNCCGGPSVGADQYLQKCKNVECKNWICDDCVATKAQLIGGDDLCFMCLVGMYTDRLLQRLSESPAKEEYLSFPCANPICAVHERLYFCDRCRINVCPRHHEHK